MSQEEFDLVLDGASKLWKHLNVYGVNGAVKVRDGNELVVKFESLEEWEKHLAFFAT